MRSDSPAKRWKLQFTLRTILLSFIPFALLFGWIGLRMQRAREREAFREQFDAPVAIIAWKNGEVEGAQLCDVVNSEVKTTDKDVSLLSGLKSICWLNIGPAPNVSDEAMPTIGKLTSLQQLTLEDTGVTDAGLVHVKSHTNLRAVVLFRCKGRVGDGALTHLATLPNLRLLFLFGTDVTDAGLASLTEFPSLIQLRLHDNPRITEEGVAACRKEMPNVEIIYSPSRDKETQQPVE